MNPHNFTATNPFMLNPIAIPRNLDYLKNLNSLLALVISPILLRILSLAVHSEGFYFDRKL